MQPLSTLDKYGKYPQDYAAPGVLSLSPRAMSDAKNFLDALGQFNPDAQWIVAFEWCVARGMKRTAESEWIEEGPGIDLAGYRYGELNSDKVTLIGGVPVIFLIPPEVVAAAKTKTVVPVMLASGRESFALA